MYRVAASGVALCLALTACAMPSVQYQKKRYLKSRVAPQVRVVHQTFTLPGPIYIPEFSGWSTAAAVSNIVVSLTRDAASRKTLWSVHYDYYNGSWTWEWKQELDVSFTDPNGMILARTEIATSTPSQHCVYNDKPVHAADRGAFDFDIARANLRLVASGRTTVGPSTAREEHKC